MLIHIEHHITHDNDFQGGKTMNGLEEGIVHW
jgi:hypothetical protein